MVDLSQTASALDAIAPARGVVKLKTVVDALSARDRRILTARILRLQPATLEEIGREFGITRERVRQVESKLLRQLRDVDVVKPWPIEDRILRLDDALGRLGLPKALAQDLALSPPPSAAALALSTYFYLHEIDVHHHYAGRSSAWAALRSDLVARQTSGPTAMRNIRRRVERDLGAIDSPELAGLLGALDVTPDLLDYLPPRTTNLERVLGAFREASRPLPKDDIARRTGLTRRQVDSVLNHNDIFQWVGRRVFAPISWGLPVYQGTEQALEDEIRARGGRCLVSDAINAVVDRFGCTEGSCDAYLSASPRFSRDGKWVILRGSQVVLARYGNPDRQRNVYDGGRESLLWAIDVDEDILRGSGHGVPASVAATLGVRSDQTVWLDLPGDRVGVRYSGTVIVSSSFRLVAAVTNAGLGDRILLHIAGNADVQLEVARPGPDPVKTALDFVGRPSTQDMVLAIAAACWQQDPSLLLETLWDRGETILLTLLGLPHRDPRGSHLDLPVLDGMLREVHMSRSSFERMTGLGRQTLVRDGGEARARVNSVDLTRVVRQLAIMLHEDPSQISARLFGTAELPSISEDVSLGVPTKPSLTAD